MEIRFIIVRTVSLLNYLENTFESRNVIQKLVS